MALSAEDYRKISDAVKGITESTDEPIKITFSKPRDKNILRARARTVDRPDGKRFLQIETFTADNKVNHRNIALSEIADAVTDAAANEFGQTNIVCAAKELQIRFSSKGKLLITKSKAVGKIPTVAAAHDREKKYIIDSAKYSDFLSILGVCDKDGNVFDKKRSKYRQLNRFVELLDDVYGKLPQSGRLTVCDLCCGKSYLTFAVYLYLEKVKGREVTMYGVDLKSDVISYCADAAEKLGLGGLHFICGDIADFDPMADVDLVISLHACDIATDIVLAYAIKHKAKLILSTPCCHHEMFHQLGDTPLSPIMKHSILKQKFADALTDSMRTLMLEAKGYKAEAIELIDPDETPKNVMIRAVYTGRESKEAADEYRKTAEFFGVDPMLAKLLSE